MVKGYSVGITDSVTVMVCVRVRLVNCYGNIMGQGISLG